MAVVVLLVVVGVLYATRAALIFRSGRFPFSRRVEWASASGVAVLLSATALVEVGAAGGLAATWSEVALLGLLVAGFVLRYRHMFHTGRVVVSLWTDLAMFLAAMGALVAALMILALRLWESAPFGAVMVAAVALFLPINAAAEVLHEGLARGQRAAGVSGEDRTRTEAG